MIFWQLNYKSTRSIGRHGKVRLGLAGNNVGTWQRLEPNDWSAPRASQSCISTWPTSVFLTPRKETTQEVCGAETKMQDGERHAVCVVRTRTEIRSVHLCAFLTQSVTGSHDGHIPSQKRPGGVWPSFWLIWLLLPPTGVTGISPKG